MLVYLLVYSDPSPVASRLSAQLLEAQVWQRELSALLDDQKPGQLPREDPQEHKGLGQEEESEFH